jgi:hypothetical protein
VESGRELDHQHPAFARSKHRRRTSPKGFSPAVRHIGHYRPDASGDGGMNGDVMVFNSPVFTTLEGFDRVLAKFPSDVTPLGRGS